MDPADTTDATLTAPSELAVPLPRRVTLNLDGDARYLLIIVLLFFLVGGITLGWRAYDDVQLFKDTALLHSSGREVVGEVTGLSYPRHAPKKVHYRFAFNGRTYSGTAAARDEGPERGLNKSDHILVRFLPSNPAVNHPSAWEWSPSIGWVWVAFQAFFWAMGCVALVLLRRDRLARKGNVVLGVVISCLPKDKSFHIEYEFRTAGGVPTRGNSDRLEGYETGSRVWVLYLPQRPVRNDLYPLLLFSVDG